MGHHHPADVILFLYIQSHAQFTFVHKCDAYILYVLYANFFNFCFIICLSALSLLHMETSFILFHC